MAIIRRPRLQILPLAPASLAGIDPSPEQIAYTIDHAGASTLLVNDEFAGLLEGLKSQLPKVKRLIVMSDRPAPQTGGLSFVGESFNAGERVARVRVTS